MQSVWWRNAEGGDLPIANLSATTTGQYRHSHPLKCTYLFKLIFLAFVDPSAPKMMTVTENSTRKKIRHLLSSKQTPQRRPLHHGGERLTMVELQFGNHLGTRPSVLDKLDKRRKLPRKNDGQEPVPDTRPSVPLASLSTRRKTHAVIAFNTPSVIYIRIA